MFDYLWVASQICTLVLPWMMILIEFHIGDGWVDTFGTRGQLYICCRWYYIWWYFMGEINLDLWFLLLLFPRHAGESLPNHFKSIDLQWDADQLQPSASTWIGLKRFWEGDHQARNHFLQTHHVMWGPRRRISDVVSILVHFTHLTMWSTKPKKIE
jgi:hypothetical protein